MSKTTPTNIWISKEPSLLPDFIMVGAMKSGTTTLHDMLNTHPDVFIPKGELHFFDQDDILQHPDFNIYKKNHFWNYPSIYKKPEEMWEFYSNKFKGKENYVKGEDSTVYLASKKAAKRISQQKKPIKIIIILRNPTKRTYSNYNHLLRTSRAIYSFEDTIVKNPHSIIGRSLYKTQIENYLKYIPREKIKFIIFEDFIKEPNATLKEISKFLNIDFKKFPSDVFNIHSNKTSPPRYPWLKLFVNRNFKSYNRFYDKHFPYVYKPIRTKAPLFLRILLIIHNYVNPLKKISPPPMNSNTKDFLDDYFKRELSGLNELIGINVLDKWFPEK